MNDTNDSNKDVLVAFLILKDSVNSGHIIKLINPDGEFFVLTENTVYIH
jgi:hypothetical protein